MLLVLGIVRGILTTIEYRLFRCSWHSVSAFFLVSVFPEKNINTKCMVGCWCCWATYPTNTNHLGPSSIAKQNLKPPASCIGYILVISTKNIKKRRENHLKATWKITPSNPGLKVEDRIRRQLSLECFDFPADLGDAQSYPKLWRDVRTTAQSPQFFLPTPNLVAGFNMF